MRLPESWNRRSTRSIAAVLSIGDQIGNGCQDPITENLPSASLEIRPFHRLDSGRLGHDAGHNAVAFAQLNHLARLKPGQELAGVTEFANVYARHY